MPLSTGPWISAIEQDNVYRGATLKMNHRLSGYNQTQSACLFSDFILLSVVEGFKTVAYESWSSSGNIECTQ